MDFEVYVAGHRRPLLRFAAVLCGDPVLAEDVVSDALGTAFQKWGRIGALDHPHAYVRKIVVNEYLGWRRRSQRLAVRADLADLIDAEPDHADAAADRQQLASELRRLPPRQRAAIAPRYFEGLAFSEIAALLGTGENAVRSNVSRGLATLRVQMSVDRDRSIPDPPREITR